MIRTVTSTNANSWSIARTARTTADAAELCVWSVLALADGTLVSGDSTGRVVFWDGTHGTQLAAFTRHAADVLALAATADGTRVVAAGVDPQLAMFHCIGGRPGAPMQHMPRTGVAKQTSQQHAPCCNGMKLRSVLHTMHTSSCTGAEPGSWTYIDTKRPHTHDVRMLLLVQRPAASPLLLSGGNDAQLIAYDANAFLKVRALFFALVFHCVPHCVPTLYHLRSTLSDWTRFRTPLCCLLQPTSTAPCWLPARSTYTSTSGSGRPTATRYIATVTVVNHCCTTVYHCTGTQATEALQQQPAPPEGTPLPCAAAPTHRLRLKKHGLEHMTALALSADGKVRVVC